MASICRQGANTIDKQHFPIIFVPGVMGSRIQIGNFVWSPEHTGKMLDWVRCFPSTSHTNLSPMVSATVLDTNDMAVDANGQNLLTPERLKRGWAGPSWQFYGAFLLSLEASPPLANCPVYAFGYDWRQGNFTSGSQLGARIKKILADEQADQVIIVSHSMGGIVTRSALRQDASLIDKVLGVVHCFQPVTGAPVLCRRFFTGATSVDNSPVPMSTILGDTRYKTAYQMSGATGPMQLLPTSEYRDTNGVNWFYKNDGNGGASAWTGDVYALYNTVASPPGLVDQTPAGINNYGINCLLTSEDDTKQAIKDLAQTIDTAKNFHTAMAGFKHPNTWSIYSTGLDTDMGVSFDASGNNVYVRRPEGDGTVPAPSASALFPGQKYAPTESVDRDKRQFEVTGIAHSDAMGDPTVQQTVFTIILNMLSLCAAAASANSPPT